MTTTLFIFALATFVSTYLGGFFALRAKDKLHLITGFSAGAVMGLAFFDLLPEAVETFGTEVRTAFTIVALGFVVYLVLDRIIGLHTHHDIHEGHTHDTAPEKGARGILRASSLSFHSMLDGLAIGFSFQVSPAMGAVVTVAVLSHDFADGINTVTAIIKSGGERKSALRWLLTDALAPVFGIILTLFISVSESSLGILLALFAGFFLYIGASDLVPESYHAHPTRWTTIATILGAGFVYAVILLAG